MDRDNFRQARLAALQEEMNAIHTANRQYWAVAAQNHGADMEYQQRQERLEQIRKEMEELTSETTQ